MKKNYFQYVYNIVIIIALVLLYFNNNNEVKTTMKTRKDTLLIYTYDAPNFYKLTPREGLKKALKYYNIKHPKIVYAQALLETGNFTSDLCTEENNLFGLYNSKTKKYYKFKHWSESVVAYKKYIQYKYKSDSSYYAFLKSIHYASDDSYIKKLHILTSKQKRNERNR